MFNVILTQIHNKKPPQSKKREDARPHPLFMAFFKLILLFGQQALDTGESAKRIRRQALRIRKPYNDPCR